MDRVATRPDRLRPAALWLFLAVVASAAFLHHPNTGWGVNSRLAVVFALVEEGTLSIDSYHDAPATATNDKSFVGGRFYSDKIFGVSLLAAPLHALMRGVGSLVGWSPSFQQSNYLLRLWAVSLPAAVAVVLLWRLMVFAGAAPGRALAAVAFAFWGSLWFGFSTAFFPYSPGIAATLGALWLVLRPPAARLGGWNGFSIGLLSGAALLFDLSFGLLIAPIAALFLLRVGIERGGLRVGIERGGLRVGIERGGLLAFPGATPGPARPRELIGIAAAGAAGALLPLLPYIAYSLSVFGALQAPYSYEFRELHREGYAQGFVGVSAPKLAPLWFLTLHPYRGLFFWYPWIALALAGLVRATRRADARRVLGWLGLWGFAAFLLANAGYFMWWGGWCMGPRLMLPMLAVVPLGLAELCRRDAPRIGWWALLATGCVSLALNLPLSILDPEIPQGNPDAVLQSVTLETPLRVPQFEYWRFFFSPPNFWHPERGLQWARVLSAAGVLLAPALLLRRARAHIAQ